MQTSRNLGQQNKAASMAPEGNKPTSGNPAKSTKMNATKINIVQCPGVGRVRKAVPEGNWAIKDPLGWKTEWKIYPQQEPGWGANPVPNPGRSRANKIMQSYGNLWPQREPGCQRCLQKDIWVNKTPSGTWVTHFHFRPVTEDNISASRCRNSREADRTISIESTLTVHRQWSWSQALDQTENWWSNPQKETGL